MSISNPKLENPAKKFIEFKGDTGKFRYFDKELEKQIELEMPLYFIVLDELSAIKGYNNRLGVGIYSNEIRSIKNDILNVRSFKGGIQIVGKYQDIKDNALREGGKFTKSVYALWIKGKDDYELVNFQFHGASFSGIGENCKSGWMNKKFNVEKYGVKVGELEQGRVGKVDFVAPIFEKVNISGKNADIWQKAIEMDKELQKYLSSYLDKKVEESITAVDPEPDYNQPDPEPEYDLSQIREKAINSGVDKEEDDLPF